MPCSCFCHCTNVLPDKAVHKKINQSQWTNPHLFQFYDRVEIHEILQFICGIGHIDGYSAETVFLYMGQATWEIQAAIKIIISVSRKLTKLSKPNLLLDIHLYHHTGLLHVLHSGRGYRVGVVRASTTSPMPNHHTGLLQVLIYGTL